MARYFRSDTGENAAISNEITGYAVSALVYLHARTGRQEFLDAALRAGRYLTREAWDPAAAAFPFEPGSHRSYFFDTGIIARGLLALSRAADGDEFRARAEEAALSLAFDFLGDGVFYPAISLPDKQPLDEEPRWSRKAGCYQLKSALAWFDLGNEQGARMYQTALAYSLATHDGFLAGETDRARLMDRLHAYCYFLEGLLAAVDHPLVRETLAGGIERVGALLREISPEFERSDVCAQLLRLRLIAAHLGAVNLDGSAAGEEARRAACFLSQVEAPRLGGGFWFGRKGGVMLPFSNPVSTAFCAQALALWQDHQSGNWRFELRELI